MAKLLDFGLASNAANLTFSVSAALNRRLIVGIAGEGAQTGDHTCDYGGQTGVLIASAIAGSGTTQQTVSLFAFTDVQITAASNTTITAGNVPTDYNISAVSIENAEQGTLTNSDTDTSGAATPNPLAALDITTVGSDAVVIAMSGMGNAGSAAWAAPLIEETDQPTASANGSMASGEIATATTVACECTWTTQNRAAAVAVGIVHASASGIASISPTTFDMDNADVDINGLGFNASQTTATVYLSDASTLAGSVNEVDISSAVNTWSDILINLDLTQLSAGELDDLQTLGPGARYIIVLTSDPTEYGSQAITLHRAGAFEMVLSGNFAPGSTTQRLTGLTGTFAGGRIEEALNPSGTDTDVAANGNREDVWNIQAKPNSRDVSYDFRVLYGDNPAGTITQTPQITVSGITIVTSSGTVQAQAAGITGAVERVITMSGTVASAAAGITGAVERVITLGGTISSDASAVSGSVSNAKTLSGVISAAAASITGAVERVVILSGVVDSVAAGISGNITVIPATSTIQPFRQTNKFRHFIVR